MKSLDIEGYWLMRWQDRLCFDEFNVWLQRVGLAGPWQTNEIVFGEGLIHARCCHTAGSFELAWRTIKVEHVWPSGVYQYLTTKDDDSELRAHLAMKS